MLWFCWAHAGFIALFITTFQNQQLLLLLIIAIVVLSFLSVRFIFGTLRCRDTADKLLCFEGNEILTLNKYLYNMIHDLILRIV